MLPRLASQATSEGKDGGPSDVGEAKGVSEGRLLAQSVGQRIRALAEGDDGGAPLQTKAIRDLEAARRSKVYSHTLIRVKYVRSLLCLHRAAEPKA